MRSSALIFILSIRLKLNLNDQGSQFREFIMTKFIQIIIISLIISACTTSGVKTESAAKLLSNSYLEASLPKDWRCTEKNYLYTCKSSSNKKTKEIIIFTAKEKGAGDTFQKYKQHLLNKPKKFSSSSLLTSKTREINQKKWFESIYKNSEVKGYTTKYLAATTNKVGVLITASAKSEIFKRSNELVFEKFISSIKLK